jgi:diguanylate cyclase (GGDEF)-like protein
LYNRRYLEARLLEEMASARRYGTALALVLLDLDHFKAINDQRGHDAGDSLLRRVGRLLRSELRGADVAARPAGDEFVVVLPRTTGDDARAFAERLRFRAGQMLDGATLSIGVGAFEPSVHADPRDLFRSADQALYRAKAAGRDAVR